MEQSGNNNAVIIYREVDCVRESSEQTTSEFIVHFWVKERMAVDIAGAGIEHPKKFIAKPR